MDKNLEKVFGQIFSESEENLVHSYDELAPLLKEFKDIPELESASELTNDLKDCLEMGRLYECFKSYIKLGTLINDVKNGMPHRREDIGNASADFQSNLRGCLELDALRSFLKDFGYYVELFDKADAEQAELDKF